MRHELRGQVFEALRACGAEICRTECGCASSLFIFRIRMATHAILFRGDGSQALRVKSMQGICIDLYATYCVVAIEVLS